MRVLSWNLFHGRSVPATRRDLLDRFAALLAGWSWDVALLQEVPPWWPPALARAASAEQRTARTSRNLGLPVRRELARLDPELMKSNAGGSNAILARVPIEAHRSVRLRRWPERRVAQLARLRDGTVVANHHGSTRVPLAERELEQLGVLALAAAGVPPAPVVLGGDLNLRDPHVAGMEHAAARDVDHVFASGLLVRGEEVLAAEVSTKGRRVALSDHPPLVAELATG
jgi:endonuclease/exonuclease/phosphatase family metal-dependent hydrolase